MFKTKTMLATLALGAAVAFAGSALAADKLKATLDGKSEVPANTSAGKGTADEPAQHHRQAEPTDESRVCLDIGGRGIDLRAVGDVGDEPGEDDKDDARPG